MKYPNKIVKKSNTKKINSVISFKNKGDNLEYDINLANHYYLSNNVAVIHKKPTPIKVVNIGEQNIIEKAFFQTPSTTDYNGIYKGRYIDFEAKETNSNTSFPLSNIHQHQIEHLINVEKHGGIAFLLILFTNLNEVYLLNIVHYQKFIKENKRKSIPIEYIKKYGYIVNYNYHPRLDYLKIVEQVFIGGNYEESQYQY